MVPRANPEQPGAYEWWYFDALSDDGRFALVVIAFLGTPMSPYYKAVMSGKQPRSRDWCGAFVTLHEKRGERWRERAYAYNLYKQGDFGDTAQTVGGTRIIRETAPSGMTWRVTVDEPGLWRGRTRAGMTFALPGPPLQIPAIGDHNAAHTWICVAPVCRAEGTITLASGDVIPFAGSGYHDHNAGVLPYADAAYWQWGRVPLRRKGETASSRTAVYYHIAAPSAPEEKNALPPPPQTTLLVFDAHGQPVITQTVSAFLPRDQQGGSYGMRYERTLFWGDAGMGEPTLTATVRDREGVFSNGPFYARFPVHAELALVAAAHDVAPDVWRGDGVGEAFRPARLLGPVTSRAMWSRIRRRGGAS